MGKAKADARNHMAEMGMDAHKIWQRRLVYDRVGKVLSDTGWRQRPGTRAAQVERFTRVYDYTTTRDTGSQVTLRKMLPGRVGTNEVWLRNTMPPELRRK